VRLSCRDDDESVDQLGDAIQAAVGRAMRGGAGTHLGSSLGNKGASQRGGGGGGGGGGGAKAGRPQQSSKTAASTRAQRGSSGLRLPGFVRGSASGGRFSRLPTGSGMPME